MADKEYIERSALIEEIRGLTTETWGKGLKNGWWSHSVQIKDNFLRLIEKSPAADVALVVHGEWFFTEYEYFSCSVCGESYLNSCDSSAEARGKLADGDVYTYCPHCGAKMDGKEATP